MVYMYLYGSCRVLCTVVGDIGMWGLGSPPLTTTAISVTSHQSVSKAFLTLPPSLPHSSFTALFCMSGPICVGVAGSVH